MNPDDEEECRRYIAKVKEEDDVDLSKKLLDAGYNPGLRMIAKLMLNSLWGMSYDKVVRYYLSLFFGRKTCSKT